MDGWLSRATAIPRLTRSTPLQHFALRDVLSRHAPKPIVAASSRLPPEGCLRLRWQIQSPERGGSVGFAGRPRKTGRPIIVAFGRIVVDFRNFGLRSKHLASAPLPRSSLGGSRAEIDDTFPGRAREMMSCGPAQAGWLSAESCKGRTYGLPGRRTRWCCDDG